MGLAPLHTRIVLVVRYTVAVHTLDLGLGLPARNTILLDATFYRTLRIRIAEYLDNIRAILKHKIGTSAHYDA